MKDTDLIERYKLVDLLIGVYPDIESAQQR